VDVGQPRPGSELVKFQSGMKRRVRRTKRVLLAGEGMGAVLMEMRVEMLGKVCSLLYSYVHGLGCFAASTTLKILLVLTFLEALG